uniref:Uncharacterized protein n=1 Tax=Lepeophtheirus salmonis TaxID=72036 RepID=A0A0K2TZ37_LEPSM
MLWDLSKGYYFSSVGNMIRLPWDFKLSSSFLL